MSKPKRRPAPRKAANPKLEGPHRQITDDKNRDLPLPESFEMLDPRYTFENYVAGPSCVQALDAAMRVANAPGRCYNPLVIYGDSGLGKTHLMQGVGHSILVKNPLARVVYIGAEPWLKQFTTSIRLGQTNAFKNNYRTADALLIDDINFIAGKERTQEELFHIFNALHDGKRQIVLTCDRYPKDLDGLDERLKMWFSWGLSVPVVPPDLEARAAILIAKAERQGLNLSLEVALLIARRIRSNVRELEGALNRLVANARLTSAAVTPDFTAESLHDIFAIHGHAVTRNSARGNAESANEISVRDFKLARRAMSPRQIATALAADIANDRVLPPLDSFEKLNPRYTFEGFVVGPSCERATAAAMRVAEAPGTEHNPLLIYSESGLGKTHLLQAIMTVRKTQRPNARIACIEAETWLAHYMRALRDDQLDAFRNYFRSLDVLLLDSIHFISGKRQALEELSDTIEILLKSKRQVVVTSDRLAQELDGLDDRLKALLSWGLSVPVDPPDLETRAGILIAKAERHGLQLPPEAAKHVAIRVRSNVRELEGALNRLVAYSRITGVEITADFAAESLSDMYGFYGCAVSLESIKKEVCRYYNIPVGGLSSSRRTQSLARARQIAMVLAVELTEHTLTEIGEAFGRDHTTVQHASVRVAELRATDPKVQEDYTTLLRRLLG